MPLGGKGRCVFPAHDGSLQRLSLKLEVSLEGFDIEMMTLPIHSLEARCQNMRIVAATIDRVE